MPTHHTGHAPGAIQASTQALGVAETRPRDPNCSCQRRLDLRKNKSTGLRLFTLWLTNSKKKMEGGGMKKRMKKILKSGLAKMNIY